MKPEGIYIMSARSSFVEVDLAILAKRYHITINTYSWQKKWLTPFFLLHQLGMLIKHSLSTKFIMISSGGYWSIVPSLFGKLFNIPVFIILNGSDCASLPAINYGNLRKFFLRNVCRISFDLAEMLLPVSESLVLTSNTYYSRIFIDYQGYKHFFPNNKTNYQVIFNGLDHNFWNNDQAAGKEKKSFISVFSSGQFVLKGGDLILEIARRFPDCTFYMAGLKQPPVNSEVSPNIRFLGHLKPLELKQFYNKCQFHFQLSVFEGFGCTLCEAMLCNCIPIGSNVNMIPQIIGDTGFILKHREVDMLEALLREALLCENKTGMGEKARNRIIKYFSVEGREQQLFALIDKIT